MPNSIDTFQSLFYIFATFDTVGLSHFETVWFPIFCSTFFFFILCPSLWKFLLSLLERGYYSGFHCWPTLVLHWDMTSSNIYVLVSNLHNPLPWVPDLYIQLQLNIFDWISLRQLILTMLKTELVTFPFRPAGSFFYTSIISLVVQTPIWDLSHSFLSVSPHCFQSPGPPDVTPLCSFCIHLLLIPYHYLCSVIHHLKHCCNFLTGLLFSARVLFHVIMCLVS